MNQLALLPLENIDTKPPSHDMRCFVEQHDVQGQVVQVLSPAIQVRRSTLNRLVCDRRVALRGDERADRAFEQVLVDAAVLIEQSKIGRASGVDAATISVLDQRCQRVNPVPTIDPVAWWCTQPANR